MLKDFCKSYRYNTKDKVIKKWLEHEHAKYPENQIKKALKHQYIHKEGTGKLFRKFIEYDKDNPAKKKNIHRY